MQHEYTVGKYKVIKYLKDSEFKFIVKFDDKICETKTDPKVLLGINNQAFYDYITEHSLSCDNKNVRVLYKCSFFYFSFTSGWKNIRMQTFRYTGKANRDINVNMNVSNFCKFNLQGTVKCNTKKFWLHIITKNCVKTFRGSKKLNIDTWLPVSDSTVLRFTCGPDIDSEFELELETSSNLCYKEIDKKNKFKVDVNLFCNSCV